MRQPGFLYAQAYAEPKRSGMILPRSVYAKECGTEEKEGRENARTEGERSGLYRTDDEYEREEAKHSTECTECRPNGRFCEKCDQKIEEGEDRLDRAVFTAVLFAIGKRKGLSCILIFGNVGTVHTVHLRFEENSKNDYNAENAQLKFGKA